MRGIFTREERAVVLFLTVSLLVGSVVMQARRVFPSSVPDFTGRQEPSAQQPAEPESAGPVDINAAGVNDLVRLPGIGPVRAAEIVRVRDLNGGFSSLDELLEVRGIGPVTLEKLRDHAVAGPGAAREDSSLVSEGTGQ